MKEIILNLNINGLQILDQQIKVLEEIYGISLNLRDDCLMYLGDDLDLFDKLVKHIKILEELIYKNHHLDVEDIYISYQNLIDEYNLHNLNIIAYTKANKPIKLKTLNQRYLYEAINNHDITIVNGPAGTGKTYLSTIMAVNALKKNEIKKIVLVRPAVEAGESLGFLPGDLKEKVDPYLIPLYDALKDVLSEDKINNYKEKGIIEVIPLAYMRGRTLNNAFIILDEAQNTTSNQMLMFLTRLGFNSKMVINGDLSQIDLNVKSGISGLKEAMDKLKNIKGLALITLAKDDIVRHPLVKEIVEAYHKR